MEVLVTIVKNLLVIVVIASFLEILLPDSSVRPFVRFAIGLFVILAILNPILAVFFSGRAMQAGAWDLPWEYEESGDYQEVGREVNRDIQKVGSELIREKIEQQIRHRGQFRGRLQAGVIMTSERISYPGLKWSLFPFQRFRRRTRMRFLLRAAGPGAEIIVKKLTSMMKTFMGSGTR